MPEENIILNPDADDAGCMKTTTDITCGYGIRIGVPLALPYQTDGWTNVATWQV